MDWGDVRYFLAVAREGTLTEAGRRTSASPSTVARRIAVLEQALGLELFVRSPEGYALTERGAALMPMAQEAEDRLLALARDAEAPPAAPSETVRVATPDLLGQHVVLPGLAGLRDTHPGIRLEAVPDIRPLRLAPHAADVLLRLARPTGGDYSMRRLGTVAHGLYASPGYAAAHGLPRTSRDLGGHRLIGWDPGLSHLPLARWLDGKAPADRFWLRATNMGMQVAAACRGLGLAVMPCAVASELGMRRALEGEPAARLEMILLVRSVLKDVSRVRAVAAAIASAVAERRSELDPALIQ